VSKYSTYLLKTKVVGFIARKLAFIQHLLLRAENKHQLHHR